MRTNWATYPIEIKDGLVTNVSPLQQGMNLPGSGVILENYEPSIEGGYKKILGYSKWSAFKVPGDTLIQGVVALPNDCAIAVNGGIYYHSTGKANWVSKLNSSGSPGGRIRHVSYNFTGVEKVVMVNGTTKPVIYNSSSVTIAIDAAAPTDVEGASYVTEFKNHIFFGVGRNLVFTAPFTDNDYNPGNGAGIINVGSVITGLVVFRDQLIIFSEDRINQLTGSGLSTFVMTPITRKTGCINGDTIQEVGGDIIYLGPDGVRYLSATQKNEDFALERASTNIQDQITNLFTGTGVFSSTVVRKKSQYRLFEWSPSVSSSLNVGYLATRFTDQEAAGISWAKIIGIQPYSIDSKQFGNEEVILFSPNATTGGSYIYEMESGTSFDGANIQCRWKTPKISITDPRVRKTFYKITNYLRADTNFSMFCQPTIGGINGEEIRPEPITFSPNSLSSIFFYGDPSTIYGTAIYGGEFKDTYLKNLVGSGFTITLDFIETSATSSFSLDTILIEYRENDRK